MKKIIFLGVLIFVSLFLLKLYNNPFNKNYSNKQDTVVQQKEKEKKTIQQKSLTAKDYFLKGNRSLKNNNIKMAILNYSKAIELDPNYIEAYKERALAKDKDGDFEGSKKDYEQYINLLEKPQKEEYEKTKHELNIVIDKIRKQIVNKEYSDAIEESTNIIESYPKYPNGYTIRGDTYFSMQEYKQALDDYKKALSLSLENKFTLYLKLANTEYELGLYKDAIRNYLYILNLNSNYEYAYYKLIGAYIFNEDFNNALTILRKYTKISKTKKIQVKDYSQWIAILNKYTENENIRDLKKNLKELNFVQS